MRASEHLHNMIRSLDYVPYSNETLMRILLHYNKEDALLLVKRFLAAERAPCRFIITRARLRL